MIKIDHLEITNGDGDLKIIQILSLRKATHTDTIALYQITLPPTICTRSIKTMSDQKVHSEKISDIIKLEQEELLIYKNTNFKSKTENCKTGL